MSSLTGTTQHTHLHTLTLIVPHPLRQRKKRLIGREPENGRLQQTNAPPPPLPPQKNVVKGMAHRRNQALFPIARKTCIQQSNVT